MFYYLSGVASGTLAPNAALAGAAFSGGKGFGIGGTTGRYSGPVWPQPARGSVASKAAKAVTIALVRKTTDMTESGNLTVGV
jgi:hypothetical protein